MIKLKKVVAAILSAAMIITCTPISTPAVSKAAGSGEYLSAMEVTMNETHVVTIEGPDSETGKSNYSWYKFNATPETDIELITTNLESTWIYCTLFDSSLKQLHYCEGNSSKTLTLGEDTTYYIRITASKTTTASFTVNGTEADALVATDPPVFQLTETIAAGPGEYTSAVEVALNQPNIVAIEEAISETGESNYFWYKFNATPKTDIELITTNLESTWIYCTLYNSSLQQLHYCEGCSSKTLTLGEDTTYYIRISTSKATIASFTVKGTEVEDLVATDPLIFQLTETIATGPGVYTSAVEVALNQPNIVAIEEAISETGERNYFWYKFNATPKTDIELITTNLESTWIYCTLYDSSLKQLHYCEGNSSKTLTLGEDTTYYIRISTSKATTASFTVNGTEAEDLVATDPPVFQLTETIATGSGVYTSAVEVALNQPNIVAIEEAISETGESNYFWYKFNATPKTDIELITTNLESTWIYCTLYNSSLQQLHYCEGCSSKTITLGEGTTYYIRISVKNPTTVSFTVKGSDEEVVPTIEPTDEPTVEATEEPTIKPTAEPTEKPTIEPTVEPTEEPTIEPTVEPTEEPTIEPTTEPTEEPTTEPTIEPTVEPTIEPTDVPTNTPDAGAGVSNFWTADTSNTSNTIELPVPKIEEVSNNSKNVSITWSCSDTSEIDGYYIYRSNDGKTWEKIATIDDVETEDYEDTNIKNGVGYGYAICSYLDNNQSENSAPAYTYFLSKVSMKSVKSNSPKKLTVKWNTNNKSSGYQIRISTTKAFKKANTQTTKVTSKSKSTKTISKLKGGKKYYVQIRAYRSYNGEVYYSDWSESKNIKVKK